MAGRTPLSKKIRFEVFKRDRFICQYCGRSAPEIVLQIDHIKPVSKGGDNDITNLITSCFDCNSGKRDRELSDDAVVKKRKAQLDELQERQEQIRMMYEWQKGLIDIENYQAGKAASLFEELTGYHVTTQGINTLRKLCSKYHFGEVIEVIHISVDQYVKQNKDTESVNKAFDYIEKICRSRRASQEKPYLRDIYYIRGILRNRFRYVADYDAKNMLEKAILRGCDVDKLKIIALDATNWSDWKAKMEALWVSEEP